LVISDGYFWRFLKDFLDVGKSRECVRSARVESDAIQMRVTPSDLKRLPDSVVTTLAMVGAIPSSILVGAGIGYLVTVLWLSNTRSDGAAAFLIAQLSRLDCLRV
jgi:hypothetical protein